MGTHAVARDAAGGVGGATTGQPRWLGGAPFVIPDLETSDVQLKGPPAKVHRDLSFAKKEFPDEIIGDQRLP